MCAQCCSTLRTCEVVFHPKHVDDSCVGLVEERKMQRVYFAVNLRYCQARGQWCALVPGKICIVGIGHVSMVLRGLLPTLEDTLLAAEVLSALRCGMGRRGH